MSLGQAFQPAATGAADAPPVAEPRRKRPAPFSLRLSPEERARLLSDAAGAPLGAYVKAKLFDGPAPKPVRRPRMAGNGVADAAALAQVLALLGRSRLANNLNQLAHLANMGALALTPETEGELTTCLAEVREMRRLLVAALGLKEASP